MDTSPATIEHAAAEFPSPIQAPALFAPDVGTEKCFWEFFTVNIRNGTRARRTCARRCGSPTRASNAAPFHGEIPPSSETMGSISDTLDRQTLSLRRPGRTSAALRRVGREFERRA